MSMVVLAMERGIVGDGREGQRGKERGISVEGGGEEMAQSQREKERELYLERGSGWRGVKGRFPGQT